MSQNIDLASLMQPHSRYPGGSLWHLTADGISIDGAPAVGTRGAPVTVTRIWSTWAVDLIRSANAYTIPVELIIATIATESTGDPKALRFEPKYVSDESTPSQVSAGLMQTLLSTAREATGNITLTREKLFVPAISIDAGTAYIRKQASVTHLDPPMVAAAYNAGWIYEDASNEPWRMRQFGNHLDRFVPWFNDAMRVMEGERIDAPSFAKMVRDAA